MLRHSRGGLRTIVLTLLITAITFGGASFLTPALMPARPGGTPALAAESPAVLVIKPTRVSWSDPELVNPLRGLYRWNTNENVPTPNPLPRRSPDAYERYVWSDFESSRGQYDFGVLEADIARADAAGQKFAFRVRAMVSGKGRLVPGYLEDQMEQGWWTDMDDDGKNDTYVPDWNDPDFMDGVQRLLTALGQRYDNDPRISYIDIGIYGMWGEWHTSGVGYNSGRAAKAMTSENRRKIVDMHIAAFPNTPLLMMTDDEHTLIYALERSPRIGWRRDSLGVDHFEGVVEDVRRIGEDKLALFLNRWKTAPVVTEFMNPRRHSDPVTYQTALEQVRRYHVSMVSNGNMFDWNDLSSTARDAVIAMAKASGYRFAPIELAVPSTIKTGERVTIQSRWINEGVAPSYERWEVLYQLRNRAGVVVWEAPSKLDLGKLLPTGENALAVSDELALPRGVAPGSYTLTLLVRDPRGARDPLALAIEGRAGDGSYSLGAVTVEAGRGVNVALETQIHLPLINR